MAEALFFHYRKGKGRVLWGVLGHTGGSPGVQEGGRGSVTRRGGVTQQVFSSCLSFLYP